MHNAKHSGGKTAQRFCRPAPKARTGVPCYGVLLFSYG